MFVHKQMTVIVHATVAGSSSQLITPASEQQTWCHCFAWQLPGEHQRGHVVQQDVCCRDRRSLFAALQL